MSGGSWEYFFYKLQDVADRLEGETCAHRNALGVLLNKCATALHDIEWVDSGDYGSGDELESIRACFEEIDIRKVAVCKLMTHRDNVQKLIELMEATQCKTD